MVKALLTFKPSAESLLGRLQKSLVERLEHLGIFFIYLFTVLRLMVKRPYRFSLIFLECLIFD